MTPVTVAFVLAVFVQGTNLDYRNLEELCQNFQVSVKFGTRVIFFFPFLLSILVDKPKMRTITNLFIFNLSLADLINTLFNSIFNFIYMKNK